MSQRKTKEEIREIQERRRSSATSPITRNPGIGNFRAIEEGYLEFLAEEDDVPCGSSYCTKDGCFNADGDLI